QVEEAAARERGRVVDVGPAVPVGGVVVVDVAVARWVAAAEHDVGPRSDHQALVADEEAATRGAVQPGEHEAHPGHGDVGVAGVVQLDPLAIRAGLGPADLGDGQATSLYFRTGARDRRSHARERDREGDERPQARQTIDTAKQHVSGKRWYASQAAVGAALQD